MLVTGTEAVGQLTARQQAYTAAKRRSQEYKIRCTTRCSETDDLIISDNLVPASDWFFGRPKPLALRPSKRAENLVPQPSEALANLGSQWRQTRPIPRPCSEAKAADL
jgi:hypothetical protein